MFSSLTHTLVVAACQEVLLWDQFKSAPFMSVVIDSHEKLFSDQRDSSVRWLESADSLQTRRNMADLSHWTEDEIRRSWLLSSLDSWDFEVKGNTAEDIWSQYIYKVNQYSKWH